MYELFREYKTGLTQDLQTKAIRKHLNMLINEYGGLPENAVSDSKKGFKKWFMAECKKRKKNRKK